MVSKSTPLYFVGDDTFLFNLPTYKDTGDMNSVIQKTQCESLI